MADNLIPIISAGITLGGVIFSCITALKKSEDNVEKKLNSFRGAIKTDISELQAKTDKTMSEFNSNCMGHVASTLAYMVSENPSYSAESKKHIGAEILGISKNPEAIDKVKTVLDLK